jgi:hypothetical protein
MNIKKILWLALFSTQFLFLALSAMMTPFDGFNFNDSLNDPIQLVILLSGFFILILSFILPKALKIANTPPQSQDVTKFVLSLALNESTTINGFILIFIFKNWTLGSALFIASILGFLFKFPKEDNLSETRSTGLDA